MMPSILTLEQQKQCWISWFGTKVERSSLRHRCTPTRHSKPRTLLVSCSLCGHSFATRAASSESEAGFSGLFRTEEESRSDYRNLQQHQPQPALHEEGGKLASRLSSTPLQVGRDTGEKNERWSAKMCHPASKEICIAQVRSAFSTFASK
jgi:hypothetical protein